MPISTDSLAQSVASDACQDFTKRDLRQIAILDEVVASKYVGRKTARSAVYQKQSAHRNIYRTAIIKKLQIKVSVAVKLKNHAAKTAQAKKIARYSTPQLGEMSTQTLFSHSLRMLLRPRSVRFALQAKELESKVLGYPILDEIIMREATTARECRKQMEAELLPVAQDCLIENSPFAQAVKNEVRDMRIKVRNDHNKGLQEHKDRYDRIAGFTAWTLEATCPLSRWDERAELLNINAAQVANAYPNVSLFFAPEPLSKDMQYNPDFQVSSVVDIISLAPDEISDLSKLYSNKTFQLTYCDITYSQSDITYSRSEWLCPHYQISAQINDTSMQLVTVILSERTKIHRACTLRKTETHRGFGDITPYIDCLNKLANRLLDGAFDDQDHAINLLLEYKYLSSLIFAIEDEHGTQFSNIVKINRLVENLKVRYPHRISKALSVPHIHDDTLLLNWNKSPEIAAVLRGYDFFLMVQQEQVDQHLNKNR